VDYDGAVNIGDFGLLRSAFGLSTGVTNFVVRSAASGATVKALATSSFGGGSSPLVPEPGTVVLLIGGGLMLSIAGLVRRRRRSR
jgi:hypothetical protein